MRTDIFLKNSRLIKRRTVAKQACENGRIDVNGRQAKPGTELKEGDLITISFGDKKIKAVVKELNSSPKKEEAAGMYEIVE
ncbi:MAG: RNA-binding S4 domain-containing protein [Eubacteriales bacterium]|nr:RNA-binding S4 domain-containing protein [Eubacteriales bacterium]